MFVCPPPPPDPPAIVGTHASAAEDHLLIDPALLAQIDHVWSLIATSENPLWPGWNAEDTPILIYQPGIQDVLINHPAPPADFRPYHGRFSYLADSIVVRSGSTLIDWDGQNTTREVYGHQTLIVADTLSNRRMTVRGLLNDPRDTESKLGDLPLEALRTDPYGQLAMIAHEAFHVFQARQAPHQGANERDVRLYPCLSVDNNVGFALEADALLRAMRAEDADAARDAGVDWLAIRDWRRAPLRPEVIAYEDGNEFSEGLAKLIEWRLFDALEGTEADDTLWWSQGFRGFDDLSAQRRELERSLQLNLRGEININNDPYGTSPVRGRLYFSGLGIAVLLDRLGSDWEAQVFQPGVTLTKLAREAVAASPAELEAARSRIETHTEFRSLRRTKLQLATDGERDTQRLLDTIEHAAGTTLVFDYSALGDVPVGLTFTGYGVRAVDDERTIYTLVPISARLGGAGGFSQSTPLATLEDRANRQYRFALGTTVDPGLVLRGLDLDQSGVAKSLNLDVVGVRVEASRARVTLQDDQLRIELLPRTADEEPSRE